MVQTTMTGLLQDTKDRWLTLARLEAQRQLAYKDSITIEDVLDICPLPSYLHRNTIGRVFSNKDFDSVGFVKSRRSVSKGRYIQQWAKKGRDEYTDLD